MKNNFALKAAFLATLLLGAHAAFAQDAFSSDWSEGLKSSARLIAAGPQAGVLQAAIEIKLAPGAITYWRNPGDAGVPPTFAFQGSSNLAQARVSFPAPRRIAESDGSVAFGYDGDLILPIELEVVKSGAPVALSLRLDYAVCEKICLPAQAFLKLDIPSAEAPGSQFAEPIAKAKAQTPRVEPWGALRAELTATSKGVWRLCLPAADSEAHDVFIEPPEAWWIDVRPQPPGTAGQSCFSLNLMQQPPDGKLPISARLTVTGGAQAQETTVVLGL